MVNDTVCDCSGASTLMLPVLSDACEIDTDPFRLKMPEPPSAGATTVISGQGTLGVLTALYALMSKVLAIVTAGSVEDALPATFARLNPAVPADTLGE